MKKKMSPFSLVRRVVLETSLVTWMQSSERAVKG
jgi:hypothetical protein